MTRKKGLTMAYHIAPAEDFVQEMGEDGPFTDRVYGVSCVDDQGHRWTHNHWFYYRHMAEELAARVTAHIASHPDWEPGEHWHVSQPVYGSEAYQLEDGEQYLARVDVEAEHGAGSYRYGHPGYIG